MNLPVCRASVRGRLAAAAAALAVLASVLVGVAPTAAATPAVDAPSTFTVTSFDGTQLDGYFFAAPTATPAPTVLIGPGWSNLAYTDPATPTSTTGGVVGVAPLLAAGYNVVTWDPRGFGTSTGQAEVDSPYFEGRDVSAILDWVAARPQALLDAAGDPRVGMAGGSYGGGVQLVAAAFDHRIDAIAPDIAWNSLLTSLDTNDTARSGWLALLNAGAQLAGQRNDPRINAFFADAAASFNIPRKAQNFIASRGPGTLVSKITAPTLLLQGTIDSLFPLREATTNYALLAAQHVPVKMVWFCGGHGMCLVNPGDTSVIESATLGWFAKYLQHRNVSTSPGFQWVDQRGSWHGSPSYPPATAAAVGAAGSGTLDLLASGGSGPYLGPLPPGGSDPARLVTATPATNAVNVSVTFAARARVLGAPTLSLTYRGTAPRPNARVLAQVVDDTGKVLGGQLTPIPVTLDGQRHKTTLPLEILAAVARPGETFTLQLVAQSSLFDTHPSGGSVRFSRVAVSLPTSGAAAGE